MDYYCSLFVQSSTRMTDDEFKGNRRRFYFISNFKSQSHAASVISPYFHVFCLQAKFPCDLNLNVVVFKRAEKALTF